VPIPWTKPEWGNLTVDKDGDGGLSLFCATWSQAIPKQRRQAYVDTLLAASQIGPLPLDVLEHHPDRPNAIAVAAELAREERGIRRLFETVLECLQTQVYSHPVERMEFTDSASGFLRQALNEQGLELTPKGRARLEKSLNTLGGTIVLFGMLSVNNHFGVE
jgi:hypothetical protein